MAEVVDLTAINSDDEPQRAAPTIDLTKDSDDEQPPVKRARREAEARDGPIKIVSWNASGILPKTGKNRDKLARLVQRIGRVDAISLSAECTVAAGRGGRRARAAARLRLLHHARPGNDAAGAQGRRRRVLYSPRQRARAQRATAAVGHQWDRWGMVGQYSCDVGVIVGAYLPTPTRKKDKRRCARRSTTSIRCS